MKRCVRCGENKPQAEFSPHRETRDRLATQCKRCSAERAGIWKQANRLRVKRRDAESYIINCAARREQVALWKRNNHGAVIAAVTARKARVKCATPAWANLAEIAKLYEEAACLTRETGVVHHVDHIVPLRSKIVSGFHVEHNLQVIPKSANLAKSNLYWPDMP